MPAARKKLNATSKTMLLGVIAQLSPFHGGKAPRELVARRAGYGNAKSNAFKMALKRASKRGHVDLSDKETVQLTELGLGEAGGAPDCLGSNEETHDKIKSDLSPKRKEVFELIKDGKVYLRSFIATSLGYQSEKENAFKMLLKRIQDKGYLNFVDKESVQLSEICFPMGRPDSEFSSLSIATSKVVTEEI